jgi:hypothetical protein
MKEKNFTLHRFHMAGMDITSVVTADEEFAGLMDLIRSSNRIINKNDGVRMTDEHIDRLAAAKHIPMIARGALTEPIFARYGVDTTFMSIIVRGQGENVLMNAIAEMEPEVPQSQLN